MEKFYIVNPDSNLGKAYLAYKTDSDLFYNTFLDFAKENGIKTTGVYLTTERLWIKPTIEDELKFDSEFIKYESGKFKKTSSLCKKWIAFCEEKGIKNVSKPNPIFFFRKDYLFDFHCRTRLFDLDNVIYCSFESEDNFSAPEGVNEIKASEFYKIMEQHNVEL